MSLLEVAKQVIIKQVDMKKPNSNKGIARSGAKIDIACKKTTEAIKQMPIQKQGGRKLSDSEVTHRINALMNWK